MSLAGARHPDVVYPATIPFIILHLACFAAVWTGVTARALALFVVLYFIRLFAVTAGYHRYFSHRSYRTSRVGQFLLALIAQSSTQRGVLWWAAIHRHHHRHSDTELDVHSLHQHGLWYSHMGWIFAKENDRPDYCFVQDLQRFPELVWLDRNPYLLPALVMLIPSWLIGGWSGVVVGYGWSTMVLYHVTFAINTVGHGVGKRPYLTGDESRNNLWLALLTLGEGWHNNHHAYQGSTRVGFRRGEIDLAYQGLKMLERLGLVWDLREPPAAVVENRVGPGRKVTEQLARELAEDLHGEIAGTEAGPPPVDEVHARLRRIYPDTPPENLRRIARRAHHLLADRLGTTPAPPA